jgi:hypothetical protein
LDGLLIKKYGFLFLRFRKPDAVVNPATGKQRLRERATKAEQSRGAADQSAVQTFQLLAISRIRVLGR